MEKLLDTIVFKYSDPEISNICANTIVTDNEYPLFFSQSEDTFIKSDSPFHIPSFSIHHDVEQIVPSEEYLSALRSVITKLAGIFPNIFVGTRYYFDPAEVLRPCFIQIFKIEDCHYLYLLRLDLNIRLSDNEIITQATNDKTAEFTTEKLVLESTIIPIHKPDISASGGEIPINRLFKSTWVSESGSGYHINGEWIDRELTKILSALYLPDNTHSYPYYPFKCDFNTVTLCPAALSAPGRKGFLSYLHKSLPMIKPVLPDIEAVLRNEKFSKDLPIYIDLKRRIPDEWTKTWSSLKISPYLNENEMREYSLEYEFSK
ncbi:MAG TPA: hypothetical protein DCO79_16465 [Spirochaeta sp.]|nr:hypothetical protein [Spirochaeta sp.]